MKIRLEDWSRGLGDDLEGIDAQRTNALDDEIPQPGEETGEIEIRSGLDWLRLRLRVKKHRNE